MLDQMFLRQFINFKFVFLVQKDHRMSTKDTKCAQWV
jgi:hypothetical protein